MAPICLPLPSLAHIFCVSSFKKESAKMMLLAMTRAVEEGEKNPIGNAESLFMSGVRGSGVDWCSAGPYLLD